MKKIIILITCFSLFMGIILPSTLLQTKASPDHEVGVNNKLINKNYCLILEPGYYIFMIINNAPIKQNIFQGEFKYASIIGSQNITSETIYNALPYDKSTYGSLFTSLISQLTKFSGVTNYYSGVAVVESLANALLFDSSNQFVLYYGYIKKNAIPPSINIAGGTTHYVDIGQPIPLQTIKNRYSASDNVDGDLTSKIVFESSYNSTNLQVGDYYISATVTDSAGHRVTAFDYIRVRDFTPPTLTLSQMEKTIEVNTVFNSSNAKNMFSATDNVTFFEDIEIIFTDNYNSSYMALGTYTISAYAEDEAGNRSDVNTLTIHVVDTTSPTVELTAGGNRICADHVLSDGEIKALFTVCDNYDKLDSSSLIIEKNTCDGTQGKAYTLIVKVKDSSGNETRKTYEYYLTDTISPVILVEKTLYVEEGIKYSTEQIINMLKEAGIIDRNATNISIETNLIEETETQTTYELTYHETLETGETKVGKIKLTTFKQVETEITSKETKNFNWSYLWLLIFIPVLLIIGLYTIRKCKYEKN